MPIKVSIGITTYKDISEKNIGSAIYNSHKEVSEKIVPNQVRIWSNKYMIDNVHDFSSHWLTLMPYKVKENKAILGSGTLRIGAEWLRTGTLAGRAEVRFRPEMQEERCDTLTINFNYSPKIDWYSLFEKLTEICEPSYAMLHVFTDKEKSYSIGKDRLERFDAPIVDEHRFVTWKTYSGSRTGPDPWEKEKRRTYRFLPQLSWANFFGHEFKGQYDRNLIKNESASFKTKKYGDLLLVTSSISDIVKNTDYFETKRTSIKKCFNDGFFP